ncbi:MAG: 3-hydroxyacyl-CoA dehydrogenase family protein [Sarcina sp.]
MEIQKIGILGTGTMGKSIALLCLQSNYDIIVYSRSESSSENFLTYIKENLDINQDILNKKIKFCYTLSALSTTDFIIEALIENLDFKKNLFKELDSIFKENIILASTTSGLLPSDISTEMIHKKRFVVAHFWNPAHIVPLVEIVPNSETSIETLNQTKAILELLGKKTITMSKECPGFIGNRIQLAIIREATNILKNEFASAKDIDDAVKYSLGFRYAATGPLESCDLGGLDIFNNVSKYLYNELSNEKDGSQLLDSYISNGILGAKTGEGFYSWNENLVQQATNKRKDVIDKILK